MTKKYTPFIKPSEILDQHQIQWLREKSDIRGISLLLHAWAVVFLTVFLFSLFLSQFHLQFIM